MPVEKVIMAVNALDLKVLSLENVELLQRMVPTDQEVCAYFYLNVNYYLKNDISLLRNTNYSRIHFR